MFKKNSLFCLLLSLLQIGNTLAQNYQITNSATEIIIQEITSNGEIISLSETGSNFRVAAPTNRTYSINGGPITSFNTIPSIPLTGKVNIRVLTAGGDDIINFAAFINNLPNLIIDGGVGNDVVNFNGNLTIGVNSVLSCNMQGGSNPGTDNINIAPNVTINSGAGGLIFSCSQKFTLGSNAHLLTSNGQISIAANQQSSATGGNFVGVDLTASGASIESSGSGNIDIRGTGGNSGSSNHGISIGSSVNIIGGTTGTINIVGKGGLSGSGSNQGLLMIGTSLQISSLGGNITINGTGGGTFGTSGNYGVALLNSAIIKSGGTGTVNVSGSGGIGAGSNISGVLLNGSGVSITSMGGNVNVSGTLNSAGQLGSSQHIAVLVTGGAIISAGGSGSVNVTGISNSGQGNENSGIKIVGPISAITSSGGNVTLDGSSGSNTPTSIFNIGVWVAGEGNISAGGTGNVQITGLTSASPSNNSGVLLSDLNSSINNAVSIQINAISTNNLTALNIGANTIIFSNAVNGNITLSANSMSINSLAVINATGANSSITLKQNTSGVNIDLGGNDITNTLGISDAELDRVSAPRIIIGSANTGNCRITNQITRITPTNITLCGNSIQPYYGFVDINAVTGSVTLNAGSTANFTLNGTLPSQNYEQLNVTGQVNLNNANLSFTGSTFVPTTASNFILVENDGTDPIQGTFSGLPEGAIINNFLAPGYYAKISYLGGTGNDVSLTVFKIDYTISTINNSIVVTDVSGNGEIIIISENSGNIQFTVPNNRGYSINGVPIGTFSSPAPSFSLSGVTSITINAGGGNDIINISGFSVPLPNFEINGNENDDVVNLNGGINFVSNANFSLDLQNDLNPGNDIILVNSNVSINTTGSGSITLKASRYITLYANSNLNSVNGNITVHANQQSTGSTGNFVGFSMPNGAASITCSGTGSISVQARGGDGTNSNFGIYMNTGGLIQGGTSGTVTVIGIGGTQLFSALSHGVYLNGNNTRITSLGASVSVTGFAGSYSGDNNFGVYLTSGANISAGNLGNVTVNGSTPHCIGTNIYGTNIISSSISSAGGNVIVNGNSGIAGGTNTNIGIALTNGAVISAAGNGTVTVTGNTSNANGNNNSGITISGFNSKITSVNGAISVIGSSTAGNTSSFNNNGIWINDGGISTTGSGNIQITGNGSNTNANNLGVYIIGSTALITSTGNITINAQSYGSNSFFLSSGAGITSTFSNKAITINSDNIKIDPNATISTFPSGSVTLREISVGREIRIGDVDQSFCMGLDDAELDRITTGNLTIGSSTTGLCRIINPISRPSNSNVTVFGQSLVPEYNAGADITTPSGTITLGSGSILNLNISNPAPFQQLDVNGSVNLNNCTLQFAGSTFVPLSGQTITLISNDGTDPVIGIFFNQPQGSVINNIFNSGMYATISYTGGTGNDVILSFFQVDYSITNTAGQLTITDNKGNSEALSVTENGGNIVFAAPTFRTYSINLGNVAQFGTPANISLTGLSNITINTGLGNDIINIGQFINSLPNLTLNGGTGNDVVNFNGNLTFSSNSVLDANLRNDISNPGADAIFVNNGADLSFSGTGSAELFVSKNIYFSSGSSITTNNGNINLIAIDLTNNYTGFNNSGVSLNNTIIESTGSGIITITGKGGDQNFNNHGIEINLGSLVKSNSGGLNLSGFGGNSIGSNNYGVSITGANTLITSISANIQVTGTGGGLTGTGSNSNYGVNITAGGKISPGGTNTLTLTGTGGNTASGNNKGVFISDANSALTSSGGNVSVNGTGGGPANQFGANNEGVKILNGGSISAGLNGNVNVTGISSQSIDQENYGIHISGSNSTITSTGGNVVVNGTGNGRSPAINSHGIKIDAGGSISSGGSGSVNVTGNGSNLTNGNANYGIYITGLLSKITSNGGAVTVTGNGRGSLTSANNHGVYLEASGQISSGGTGLITVTGTGSQTPSSPNHGIYIINNSSGIISSGGNIVVNGNSLSTSSSGSSFGVYIDGGGFIKAGGLGDVQVTGTGSGFGSNNHGVYLVGGSSNISSNNGNVTVNGNGGGNSAGNNNNGIFVAANAQIFAGGVGTLQVNGIGGVAGGSGNHGLLVSGTNASIFSSSGDVIVTGSLPASSTFSSHGVLVSAGGTIRSLSNGNITVNGTGCPGNNSGSQGVQIIGVNSSINTFNGNILINGTANGNNSYGVFVSTNAGISSGGNGNVNIVGNAYGTTGTNYGVIVFNLSTQIASAGNIFIDAFATIGSNAFGLSSGSSLLSTGSSGNITIKANSIDLSSGQSINTAAGGSVLLLPKTNGNPVNLGGTDATNLLGLTDSELDIINTGTLTIGDNNTGTLTISNAISRNVATNVVLNSSSLLPDFNGIDINSAGGTITLGSASIVSIDIDGLTAGTNYKQLNLNGLVNLNNASLTFNGSSYVPVGGESFLILNNDGIDAISGTFNNLPEGATINNFLGGTLSAAISYTGGTGNDVVVTVCSIPSVGISASATSVCIGNSVTLNGTGASTYTWNNGVNNGVAFNPPLGNTLYTVIGTSAPGCSSTSSITITGLPLPSASISGSQSVCQSSTSPNLTFTGSNATPPYTFTYNINGGINQTISTIAGNSVTLPVPTNNSGIFNYNLVGVSSSFGCYQAASGSATITINPGPDYSIAASPDNGCLGQNVAFSSTPLCNSNSISMTGSGQGSRNVVVTNVQNNVSMEAWVNWDGTNTGNSMIVVNGNTGNNGYAIYHNNGTLVGLLGGVAFMNSNLMLTANTWQHIALVRNAGTWTIYLNGVAGTLTNSTATPNAPTTGTFVGSNNAFTQRFRGRIDEVRIWTKALSLAEINAHKNSCTVFPQNGLAAYWNFNQGSGTIATDQSGNARDLTLSGTTWSSPANQGFTGLYNLGNGITANGFSANHTYSIDNTYNATFTTTDGNGCSSIANTTVVVNPIGAPPTITIAITNGSQVTCNGDPVTFSATITNGGNSPFYQWKKNGNNTGSNSPNYTDPGLMNNDVISCDITSNAICTSTTPVSSNAITISVIQTSTWLGITGNWHDNDNWCGFIPTMNTDVIIPNTSIQPILSAPATCKNLILNANANLTLNHQSLSIYGEISGTGIISGSGSSSIYFSGTGPAGILKLSNSTQAGKSLYNLSLDRPGESLILGDTLLLYNTLQIASGILQTNNQLILKSNAAGTARIAAVGISGGITGNITAERFVPSGLTGWAMLGSPVTNATISDWTTPWPASGFPTSGFTGSTGWAGGFVSIYSYNESVPGPYDVGYVPASNITNPLINGKGLYTYLGTTQTNSSDINFKVYGAPYVGDKNLNITFTSSAGGITADGWNLVANPYACDIDWDSPDWVKTNVDNAIYIYNADYGQMATYVAGIGTNGGSNYLASHQGFFVKANSSSPTLICKENTKVPTNTALLRSRGNSEDIAILRFRVNNTPTLISDETVVRINPNADQLVNSNLESFKVYPQNLETANIFTIKDNQELSIMALAQIEEKSTIPLKVKVPQPGEYSIEIGGIEDLMNLYPALFANNQLEIHNLNSGEIISLNSSGSYSFSIEGNELVLNLLIKFSNNLLSLKNKSEMMDLIEIVHDQTGYFVKASLSESKPITVNVFNGHGQKINSTLEGAKKEHLIKIETTNFNSGVYIVQIATEEKLFNKKIVVGH